MQIILFILYAANQIGEMLSWIFSWVSDGLQLILISFTVAIVFMQGFKKISDQSRIAYHRNQIVGHLLEISIYRDQLSSILSGQAAMVKHGVFYLGCVGKPFLVLMLPMLIICLQVDNHFGYRPMNIGRSFIIKAELDPNSMPQVESALERIYCLPSSGLELETPALRIASENTTYWRAVAVVAGNHVMRFGISGEPIAMEKNIVVSDIQTRLSPVRAKTSSLYYSLYPTATPIAADAGFMSVSVDYPRRTYQFFGWQLSPIAFFFWVSLIFGIPIKFFLNVKI